MCGICGAFNQDLKPADSRPVEAMSSALIHRGPDDAGLHVDGPAALGFRRLSILDLEGGHQPMLSEDAQVAVVFNGEIYNHPQLKAELESQGVRYKTHSDTETILQLYLREGKSAVCRLEGMFAFAVWDRRKKTMILARDRLGIKPLYYSLERGRLAFASELRALLRSGISKEFDPLALWDYLNYGYVHSPRTIFRSALRLPPGHMLVAGTSGAGLQKYWSLRGESPPEAEFAKSAAAYDSEGRGGGAVLEELEKRLSDAVRSHLLSDVPVGAFLSGGLDSSLVAALMTRALPRVSTFTIGFEGAKRGLDESKWARRVAQHLGTDHHEERLPADVLNRIEDFADCLDEPIADSAILPTYFLSRFARKNVKVVLTGEGADELFAGYDRYKAAYISEKIFGLPRSFQPFAAGLARILNRSRPFARLPIQGPSDWALACRNGKEEDIPPYLSRDVLDCVSPAWEDWVKDLSGLSGLNGALTCDLRTVLSECLLMKVDKTGMKASLEARVPFLDRALVEFALSIPSREKIRYFKGKFILRKLALKYLPSDICFRRKHGFWVPWEEWVRSPKSVVEEALHSSSLKRSGLFDQGILLKNLSELREGSSTHDAGLFFRITVFALWLASLD